MNAKPAANPFDTLPPQLFNILGTGSFVNLQRHHMAVLLRIYDLAEFNRFGLTREIVLAEIVDYLGDAQAAAEVAASAAADGDAGVTGEKSLQEFASWLLRRLAESGWVEREQGADYTEYIILPDYAFTLLEAFRAIGQQWPREYTGQLYAAHQLITSEHEEFSPALAVTQAYESVRGLVRGLNELNQNIRRYTERVTKDKPVPELMRMQFDDYAPALGAAYHALKTSDHISRYRRDIVDRLEAWLQDDDWLDRAAGELALQRRVTPGQAEHEISHALHFIVEQLEGLDPLLAELDRRHTQYLRTSLRQVQYQMSSADGNFKERLIGLAQRRAAARPGGNRSASRGSGPPANPSPRARSRELFHHAGCAWALRAGCHRRAAARPARCRGIAQRRTAGDRYGHHAAAHPAIRQPLLQWSLAPARRRAAAGLLRRHAVGYLDPGLRSSSRGWLRRRSRIRGAGGDRPVPGAALRVGEARERTQCSQLTPSSNPLACPNARGETSRVS